MIECLSLQLSDETIISLQDRHFEAANYLRDLKDFGAFESSELIKLSNISRDIWRKVMLVHEAVSPQSMAVRKVTDSNANIYLDSQVCQIFDTWSTAQFNTIYRAAQQLAMKTVMHSIHIYLACKIWHKPSQKEYEARKQQLGIKNTFDGQNRKELDSRFPFLT